MTFAAVVVNPARVARLHRLREHAEQAARQHGWAAPLYLRTTAADAGAGAARSALAAGASMVVAVGGDGTVHACVQALAGSGVPLAIVPAGTANLTARALHLPAGLNAALAVAFGGADATIDLGLADEGTYFTAMAGLGLDAAVVAGTPALMRRVAGWPAYAAGALSHLLRSPVAFTITLDDREPMRRLARSVTVGNSGSLPGGFPILPDARPDDGVLDVVVLAPADLLGWLQIGLRVAARSDRNDLQLERFQARRVEIRAAAELPRQVDGEIIASGRSLSVAVCPGALRVRVPAGSLPDSASRASRAG